MEIFLNEKPQANSWGLIAFVSLQGLLPLNLSGHQPGKARPPSSGSPSCPYLSL